MKQIIPNYTFDPAAKTVTFSDFTALRQERILLVTNVTANAILYNFAAPGKGGTVSGNVLTLAAATTGMLATDKLSIQYETAMGDPDYSRVINVETERNTWRRNFNGTALDPAHWDLVQTGAGHTVTVANGQLEIASGTTINTETIIRSKKGFQLPFRVQWHQLISQRIANQEFYLELVNAAGDTYNGYMFDGTSSTAAKSVHMNGGFSQPASPSGAFGVAASSGTAPTIREIDVRADAVDMMDRTADSAVGSTIRLVRSRTLLDPGEDYFIQMRVKNLGTAPASSTSMKIESVLVQDMTKLVAEIAAGRGNQVAGRSVPVALAGITVGVNQTSSIRQGLQGTAGIWVDDTSTNLAAGATFTGASRDIMHASSAAQMGSSSYPRIIRGCAISSHAGTLFLEVSKDNTNWHRIKKVDLTQAADGVKFYGEMQHEPCTRYARWVFLNGATATTTLLVQSHFLAN